MYSGQQVEFVDIPLCTFLIVHFGRGNIKKYLFQTLLSTKLNLIRLFRLENGIVIKIIHKNMSRILVVVGVRN